MFISLCLVRLWNKFSWCSIIAPTAHHQHLAGGWWRFAPQGSQQSISFLRRSNWWRRDWWSGSRAGRVGMILANTDDREEESVANILENC
nr:hypothetical protein Itr_chr07CG05560 [Ipomoea trifida]